MGEENKKTSPINIRSIYSLLKEKFNIPRYQRGYRWEKTQIIELLDDIYDYGTKARDNKAGNFYCLQPIVVKRNVNKIWWDLIDGQQRLTTIFIILKYIIQYLPPNEQIPLFPINYETRNNDQNENKGQGCEFLNKISFDPNKKPNTVNIDFYHMDMCSKYIVEWFTSHPPKARGIFEWVLISDDAKNVSVIWYEVDSDADKSKDQKDQIDVFKRLNIGKILLTDSELIKAFLLQGDIYEKDKYIQQRLFEIAKEWDNIEYHLQKNEMWEFLNNKSYNPESRIEYLFKILSEDWNLVLDKPITDKGKQFEYHVFEKYIGKKRGNENDIKTVVDIFDEIKILFSVLDEWYNDRQMYHYIGFLVCQHEKENESVKLIKELFNYFQGDMQSNGKRSENGHTRPECFEDIKTKIKEIISLESNQKLEKLNYKVSKDKEKLNKLLLFFNIESTIRLENENTRFPFHLYKEENKEKKSSIEHIHPQTPEEPDYEQAKAWLDSYKFTLPSIINNITRSDDEKKECINIQDKINKLLDHPDDPDFKKQFNILSGEIDKLFEKLTGMPADETDTLSNYALVRKDANTKLSNNSFQKKREIIINIIKGEEKDDRGKKIYIPVCTRNVFQKYYTSLPNNIILWDKKDRDAYFTAMKKLYDEFMGKIKTEADN